MTSSRLRIAGVVLIAISLLTGSLSLTQAQSSERASQPSSARHDFDHSAEQVRRFWTRERMRETEPLVMELEGAAEPVDGWGEAGVAGARSLLAAAIEEAPYTRYEIEDPSRYPYRVQGKLFVRAGRGEYHCSATALRSANESVVFTAGHCLYGSDIGGWVDLVAFVPGYRFANRPYGTWVAQSALVTPGWLSTETARADIGAVVMEPFEGSTLIDAVGGRGISFGVPRVQNFQVFGYPADPPFDGERLYVCEAPMYWRDETPHGLGPDPMGLGCDMTQGSSGGGWVINGTSLNSINSYGYEDGDGDELPYMFGPYFGTIARALFVEASAVPVVVPEPFPSATVTPTEVPSPSVSPTEAPIPTPDPTEAPSATRSIADRNDSRGLFDIARVTVSNPPGSIVVDLTTHDRWPVRLLSSSYPRNVVFVDFDSFGGPGLDYYLAVFARDGRLVGQILRYAPGQDAFVDTVAVTRSSRRNFSATFPHALLQSNAKLRWVATSFFKTRNRCATGCRDHAPNRGLTGF